MARMIYTDVLWLFLIPLLHGLPSQKLPDDMYSVNFCTDGGGSCVKERNCRGWVDSPAGTSCGGKTVCCMPIPVTSHPEPADPGDASCGQITRISSPDRVARIVGGSDALEGEWPWQVAFVDSAGDSFCGGTLVSSEFVLTAAHCFQDPSHTSATTMAILGEHHTQLETGNEIKMTISTIVTHDAYSANGHPYDIALVKLSSPVDITGHYVRTACLPSAGANWTSEDACFASGWGYTSGTNDRRHLQHIRLDIVDTSDCSKLWGDGVVIGNDHVCAGMGNTGTCNGDSGGPLVCQRDGWYVLAGVTSWGHFTCTATGYPDVYTRVSSYLSWIEQHMDA